MSGFDDTEHKQKMIDEETLRLGKIFKQLNGKGSSLAQILCRPESSYVNMLQEYPESMNDHGEEINFQIELLLKFAGYIGRQESEVAKLSNLEGIRVPADFDFTTVQGLRIEARQKLAKVSPNNLGQASRISGVSPADISVLMVALSRYAAE